MGLLGGLAHFEELGSHLGLLLIVFIMVHEELLPDSVLIIDQVIKELTLDFRVTAVDVRKEFFDFFIFLDGVEFFVGHDLVDADLELEVLLLGLEVELAIGLTADAV